MTSESNVSSTISTTYSQFLSQLLRTKCLYKGEKDTDDYVLRKQEKLLALIDAKNDNNLEAKCKQYIAFFNEITNIVKDKKPVNLTDKEFFLYFCKVIEKKNNKCGNIFFLNEGRERNFINIGSLVKGQDNKNQVEIKNYIYILYVHCCNLLYPNIFSSSVGVPVNIYNNYHDVLKDFEVPAEESSNNGDIKSELKSILKDVFPTTNGSSGGIADIMNDPSLNKIIDTVLNTVCSGDKMEELREDIKNTNRDELLSTVNEIKDKMSSFNFEKIFENVVQSEDIFSSVSKTFDVLNEEGIIGGINKEELNETLKNMAEGDGNKILEDALSEIFQNKM